MSETPQLVKRFFDRLMELRPVEASYHGLHQHDRRLPEGTLAAQRDLLQLLAGFESDLEREGSGFDLDVARYYVRLARFLMEELRLWERMAEAPDQIGTAVFLLFARDFAPLDERLDAIAERLEGVPRFLASSRECLREPVALWNRIAMETALQLPGLFSAVVSAAPSGRLRARLEAAAAAASEACTDFANWLESEVVPRGDSGWPLGQAALTRLLQTRRLPDGPDAIRKLGHEQLAAAKAEREELVVRHWPGRSLREVNELVRAQHEADFDSTLEGYREVIATSRSFVGERGLATLPEGEELRVEETPTFLRHVIPFAAYEPAARFDQRQLGIYIVSPPRADGGLGEHSRASIRNTSVHEGYPGHHLQFVCANRHPSLARLLAADHAIEFVEGWAHYCEQLMFEEGFSAGPEVRFVQLNDQIWRACRIVIDIELSSGEMSFANATALLTREAGMSASGAEAEVKRYTYTPGYQLSYLYGKSLLLDLRRRRREADGPSFDLRQFHDTLLYAGALPAAMWDRLFTANGQPAPR